MNGWSLSYRCLGMFMSYLYINVFILCFSCSSWFFAVQVVSRLFSSGTEIDHHRLYMGLPWAVHLQVTD